jgi:UDP-perosamine 4-acetyltransferase
MTKVIGLGAGGHARVVIDTLRSIGGFDIVGLLDQDKSLWHTEVLGVTVLGDDGMIEGMRRDGIESAFIGLGVIRNFQPRIQLYERAKSLGFKIVSAVHPLATVSRFASLGEGPTVMAGAIINAATKVGDNVIINTGAIVEHDCEIGDHSHIATGARLAGGVRIGRSTHIGLGACIKEGIIVGDNSLVGAGAVVLSNVPENTVVAGVPARTLEPAIS